MIPTITNPTTNLTPSPITTSPINLTSPINTTNPTPNPVAATWGRLVTCGRLESASQGQTLFK